MVSVIHSSSHLPAGRPARGRIPEIPPPGLDEVRSRAARSGGRGFSLELGAFVVLASIAAALLITIHYVWQLRSELDTTVVVERIIRAESNGNSKARNSRSTATGAGQILEQTWIEMIHRHRPELAVGRARSDVLDLRGDPALTREIVTRMVERNASTFRKRGLPVTPGTLYLAHFAGPAGAVALLTSADKLDAASLLAAADASGRSSREQLVKANPFLATITVGELKSWADRRMRG